jgi:hypothetical protein
MRCRHRSATHRPERAPSAAALAGALAALPALRAIWAAPAGRRWGPWRASWRPVRPDHRPDMSSTLTIGGSAINVAAARIEMDRLY